MTTTRYFVERNAQGEAIVLARIVWDESGMWAEYLDGGEWVEDRTALDFLTDPSYGEEISETEAHEIAFRLGGT